MTMKKHRIVIESDNPHELARTLLMELEHYVKDHPAIAPTIKPLKEKCYICQVPMVEKTGIGKNGKPYHMKQCTQVSNHVVWVKQ